MNLEIGHLITREENGTSDDNVVGESSEVTNKCVAYAREDNKKAVGGDEVSLFMADDQIHFNVTVPCVQIESVTERQTKVVLPNLKSILN